MNRKKLGCVFLLFLICGMAQGQDHASVNGFVRDVTTGETLLMANVVLSGTTTGAATNNAGYYTLTDLVPGLYTLRASYIGYRPFLVDVNLAAGETRRLDIELAPEGLVADEIEVTAEREAEEEVRRVGVARLKTATIKQLPAVFEADVFRALQLLPGVKSSSDYSSGLYIRGGSPDQTLVLLDGTTVYNPSHFFGFFSTFNPDAIKDIRLYKGGYPAQYGGRLGSVVDIYNKDGNRRSTHGSVTVGLLASRAVAEGPHRKGSWMLAVRRSTLEPLLAALRGQEGVPDAYYFLDVNGKVNLDASKNDHLSMAFYGGQDLLRLPFLEDAKVNLFYGNRTLSTQWTHVFSQNLFGKMTLTASRYFNQPVFSIGGTPLERTNNVYDLSARTDIEYIPNRRHSLSAGFWSGLFTFRLLDFFDNEKTLSERIHTAYHAVYVQETYRPTSRWMLQGGLRAAYFGEGRYLRFEPRLSLEYRPMASVRFQLGYGKYYQFLTLVTSELFPGFDIWLTTGDGVKPAYGDQFVAGVKTDLADGLHLDVETYYRNMEDLFELDPFLPDATGLDYAQLFHFGNGYAYGSEVTFEKSKGRLNGYVGYTAGITRRRFPDLNNFAAFPPKYDRTHEINLVVNYELSPSWRISAVFNYATGQAYTEPASQYKLVGQPFGSQVTDVLVSPFNRARLPAYHRLDLGASKRGRFFGVANYELQLQIINVFKRRNIWFYFFEFENDNRIKRSEIPQIPVPLPNISFTLRF